MGADVVTDERLNDEQVIAEFFTEFDRRVAEGMEHIAILRPTLEKIAAEEPERFAGEILKFFAEQETRG